MRSTKNRWWRVERAARRFALTMALVAVATQVPAAQTVIDFESLADLDSVAGQFEPSMGVMFANAIALQSGEAGGSLNEYEFPPRSGFAVVTGSDVAFGGAGPLVIEFLQPVTAVWAFFTHEAQLTLSVFDSSRTLLGTAVSGSGSNLLLSGSGNPNERLDFSGLGEISELTIESSGVFDLSLDGTRLAFYTLDDLTFERAAPVNGVPEPGTLLLVLSGVVGLGRRRGRLVG